MIVVAFFITDQANKVKFFEKTFLITNISLEIVFIMFFFILSGINVNFLRKKLR